MFFALFLDVDTHGRCLRTSLLLQFMEYLERHLYNAIEGCAVTMAPLPKVLLSHYVMHYVLRVLLNCENWNCLIPLLHTDHISDDSLYKLMFILLTLLYFVSG